MYDQTTRRQIIDNAERDLSQAIQSGDPHRIAQARNAAENAYTAVTQYTKQGTDTLRQALRAPIISIAYEKESGESVVVRRDPVTGRKYTTRANTLTREEKHFTVTAERRETPYRVIWTPREERRQ